MRKGTTRRTIKEIVANARAIGADTASGRAAERRSERLREQPYATQEQEQEESGGLTKRSEWRIQAEVCRFIYVGEQ